MKKTALLFCLFLRLRGSLPGGSDAVNKGYYQSDNQMRDFIDTLQPGMSKSEVFARLGRNEDQLKRLSRAETVAALFGGNSGIPATFTIEGGDVKTFLESLAGYSIQYKNTSRVHGFTSPIRVRTDETGYNYSANLIFRNGVLYEKPVISGGPVNDVDTSTLFDYLNPGVLFGAAIN